jgi:tRNA-Thr(GGU) m(6)t(6)A37 methyltransferase TsaA
MDGPPTFETIRPEAIMRSLMNLVTLALALTSFPSSTSFADEVSAEKYLAMQPIGHIRKSDNRTLIVLDEKYEPGLLGLEGFSHIHVFWWFDRNDTSEKRRVLQVHPMGDPENPLTGVFATRSPIRPNLIALTLCNIISVKDNVIEVEEIDAFDGTPVLDIKPFIAGHDSALDATIPDWLERASERRESKRKRE